MVVHCIHCTVKEFSIGNVSPSSPLNLNVLLNGKPISVYNSVHISVSQLSKLIGCDVRTRCDDSVLPVCCLLFCSSIVRHVDLDQARDGRQQVAFSILNI